MKNHGTALSEGQLAEFLGAGTKALTLIANQLGPDLTDNWARNSGAMQKAFLSALCPLAAPVAKPPTLVLHKTTALGEIASKKISKCLTGEYWAYRDSDIDRWLRPVHGTQPACSVGVYQLQNATGTTFREMTAATLKVGPGTALDLLAKTLKEQGHTLTLPAIESMVERQEGGEDVGLRTDGYANLFFVEDADGSVSVLRVYRGAGGWGAYVFRLGRGHRWSAEDRLLLRNSDAGTL